MATQQAPHDAKAATRAMWALGDYHRFALETVWDVGPVLVYRRAVVVDVNPNRYYGEDRGDRLNRYELVLLYLDGEGRIVRRAIEPE